MIFDLIINNIIKCHRNDKKYEIYYENAKNILKNEKNAILIDVRSEQEFNEGHLIGSINVPIYDIQKKIDEFPKDKECIIILYCQSGARSKKALKILEKKGYKNLYEIKGGLDEI